MQKYELFHRFFSSDMVDNHTIPLDESISTHIQEGVCS